MPSLRLPIAVALSVLLGTTSCGAATAAPTAFRAKVAYVVDGDTLRVRDPSGDLEYVRLVGMLSRVSRPTLRLPVVVAG
jgi:endonuclease YncB( thermonuclease family)